MKRLLFIYNPNAGKAKIASQLSELVELFSSEGFEVIVKPTAKRGDATEFAKVYATEQLCDRIVCAGGDGTLNEVVTGVMIAGKAIPVGFIPAGTTNDFAYSLKIPNEPIEAAHLGVCGPVCPSDVGSINGTTFVYTAAFGLFSEVSYDTPQNMKNLFGRTAYILRGVSSLHNVKTYNLTVDYVSVDGEETMLHAEGEFIYGGISNSNSVGGFRGLLGNDVRFDDGVFEMLLVRKPKNIIELTTTANELIAKHLDTEHFVYAHVKQAHIKAESQLPWSLDGEFGGDIQDADIKVLEKAIGYIRHP